MEIKEANLKFTETLKKRKKTTEIILHCSATPEGRNYTVETIHKMHLANKWAGIGYNFYIDLNGTIWKGRGEEYVGAHTTNHNSISIGICYCGGVATNGKTAKDTRNEKQKEALAWIVKELMAKYPSATVHGHYEFAAKACPSFNVKEWMNSLTEETETPEQNEDKEETDDVSDDESDAGDLDEETEPIEEETSGDCEETTEMGTEKETTIFEKILLFFTELISKIFGK